MSEQKFSLQEATERVWEVEEKYDLLQYTVDGWCAWTLCRIPCTILLTSVKKSSQRLDRKEQRVIILRDIQRLLKAQKVQYVFKTDSSGLADPESGLYRDIWVDDLIQAIGFENSFKIEEVYIPSFISRRKDAFFKSDITTVFFDEFSLYLSKRNRITPKYITNVAQNLYNCLYNGFGTEVLTYKWIRQRLTRFYWKKKLYKLLFWRLKSTYLITVNAVHYELIAAAKEQQSTVVELQHGGFDKYYPLYSWSTYAMKYKSLMPIPDRIFLYGDYWKKEIDTWSFWGASLRVVGSPRIDRYRERKNTAKKEEYIILLLTTQGIDQENIITFMSNFLHIAKGQLDIQLYIKLHPRFDMNKELYQNGFQEYDKVHVLKGNENPSTFDLLTQVHFHLSIYSSCHYEALALSVPTIILPFTRHESVLHLHTKGHAFLVHTPKDILDIIMSTQNYNVPDEVSEYYFKSNALENMKRDLAHTYKEQS